MALMYLAGLNDIMVIRKIKERIKKWKGELDMTKKDAYIWFSGATDVTGKTLADKLGIDGGKTKPKGKKLVIGWGTKTKDDTVFPVGTVVLNHPNKVRSNRNKLTTLRTLEPKMTAAFMDANSILTALADAKSVIKFPLVGRTNYHQGGKGFWICLTLSHVRNAIDEGAQYFQNYIDIRDEFRLHVFGDKIIYAQKKVKRTNLEEAYIAQRAEKITNIAGKNDRKLDKSTLDYALGRLAKEHSAVDMIVRSNRKGWKFSHVKTVDKAMEKQAIAALKAVSLDFGAVDCCLDMDGKPWVIEINSGPGLDGSTLNTYVDTFKAKLKEIMTPPKPAEYRPVTREERAPAKKITEQESKLQSGSAKTRLAGMRELLAIVEDADEAEARVVEGLMRRKLGAI